MLKYLLGLVWHKALSVSALSEDPTTLIMVSWTGLLAIAWCQNTCCICTCWCKPILEYLHRLSARVLCIHDRLDTYKNCTCINMYILICKFRLIYPYKNGQLNVYMENADYSCMERYWKVLILTKKGLKKYLMFGHFNQEFFSILSYACTYAGMRITLCDPCDECGRESFFNAGPVIHKMNHICKLLTNYNHYYTGNNLTFWVCPKTCRNCCSLTCHMKTCQQPEQNFQNRPGTVHNNLVCCVCNKHCESIASHSHKK